jgi:hypothetical protein
MSAVAFECRVSVARCNACGPGGASGCPCIESTWRVNAADNVMRDCADNGALTRYASAAMQQLPAIAIA